MCPEGRAPTLAGSGLRGPGGQRDSLFGARAAWWAVTPVPDMGAAGGPELCSGPVETPVGQPWGAIHQARDSLLQSSAGSRGAYGSH